MLAKIVVAAVLYITLMWLTGARIMREAAGYLLHRKTSV